MTTLREANALKNRSPIQAKDMFTYSFIWTLAELTAGASIPKDVTIQKGSEFLWLKATFFATINNTAALTMQTRVVPQATFQWSDTSSGAQLFNNAIPVNAFWGTGDSPFILPEPKLLDSTTTVTVSATNTHATEAYALTLAMIGIRIYRD